MTVISTEYLCRPWGIRKVQGGTRPYTFPGCGGLTEQ